MNNRVKTLLTSRSAAWLLALIIPLTLVFVKDYLLYIKVNPYFLEIEDQYHNKFFAITHHQPRQNYHYGSGILIKAKGDTDYWHRHWYRHQLNFKVLTSKSVVITAPDRKNSYSMTRFFDLKNREIYLRKTLPDALSKKITNQVNIEEKLTTDDTKPLLKKMGYFRWRLMLNKFILK